MIELGPPETSIIRTGGATRHLLLATLSFDFPFTSGFTALSATLVFSPALAFGSDLAGFSATFVPDVAAGFVATVGA